MKKLPPINLYNADLLKPRHSSPVVFIYPQRSKVRACKESVINLSTTYKVTHLLGTPLKNNSSVQTAIPVAIKPKKQCCNNPKQSTCESYGSCNTMDVPNEEELTNAEMMEALLVYKRPVSEEQCVKFVTQNGIQIHMIPEHMKTERVCIAAVKQCGSAIAFVPDDGITEEICITACKYERVAEIVALLLPKHMLTNRVVYQAIYTSKYGITTIDEPSEDMISLHKLLWSL